MFQRNTEEPFGVIPSDFMIFSDQAGAFGKQPHLELNKYALLKRVRVFKKSTFWLSFGTETFF